MRNIQLCASEEDRVVARERISNGFMEDTMSKMGKNGFGDEIIYTMQEDNVFIGAISVREAWGTLWVKNLYVEKEYRGRGYARQLLQHAMDISKGEGHTFAFLETFSFQALDFYLKLGFELEFTRHGYGDGISFHYLKKVYDK